MRGFIVGALTLVALDVVLRAPGTRVADALATPAGWLARWADARTPLISGRGSAAASSSGPAAKSNVNQLGESTTGQCPPGFPAGIKCLPM